jgi:hypothetical protein
MEDNNLYNEYVKTLAERRIFLQESLANFKYKIPNNPQEKLYDFYFLSLIGDAESLRGTNMARAWGHQYMGVQSGNQDAYGKLMPTTSPEESGFRGGYFTDERIENLIAATKDTQNKLINHLQRDLLDATYFAIAAEIRHVFDFNTTNSVFEIVNKSDLEYKSEFAKFYKNFTFTLKSLSAANTIKNFTDTTDPLYSLALRFNTHENPKNKEQVATFFKNNEKRIKTYASAKNAFKNNDAGFIEVAKFLFTDTHWGAQYGGSKWANICDGWLKLSDAKTNLMKMVYIDHIFDLEHNTGSLLNKVERYAVGGQWDWIKTALDYKRNSTKPIVDFIDKISPQLKELADTLRYAITGIADDRAEDLAKIDSDIIEKETIKISTDTKNATTENEIVKKSDITANAGVYVAGLAKYKVKSTPLAHSGPAGMKNIKSLVLSTLGLAAGSGRHSYSGYLKIKSGGKTFISHGSGNSSPVFNIVGTDGKSHKVKPHKDKAVVKHLSFIVQKDPAKYKYYNHIIINAGEIGGATLNNVIFNGPVKLEGCWIGNNCYLTSKAKANVVSDGITLTLPVVDDL